MDEQHQEPQAAPAETTDEEAPPESQPGSAGQAADLETAPAEASATSAEAAPLPGPATIAEPAVSAEAETEADAPTGPMPASEAPAYPAYQPAAPLPDAGPYPSQPAAPYPSQPAPYSAYPSAPSMPLPGPYPTYGSPYPTYPGAASSPSMPLYGMPPSGYAPSITAVGERPAAASPLARPFTRWTSAFVAVGAVTFLALVYSAAELLFHADWAQGATAAGYAGLALAALAVIVTGVRVALGRRALSAVALGLLLSVGLAGSGLGGILLTNPLHHVQAQSLETSGLYEAAIHEYTLSGEAGPNATDIARAYDEWGESLLRQGTFLQALTRFNVVITQFAQSGDSVDRAYTGFFDTYLAWVKSGHPDVPYLDAIDFFQSYRGRGACEATCQSSARDAEAMARYQYGVALINQSAFSQAIVQLDTLQAQFPQSSYATLAHAEDAKAYLGLGKQELAGTCSDAIPTYQTLASKYADTPEGQQAKAALSAPVTVTGTILHVPTDPTPTAYLSKQANPGGFYFSDDYSSAVDGHTGDFTFSKVKQGSYNLSTTRPIAGGTEYVWWQADDGNLYIVHVGPLCTVQLGTFSYT